VDPAPTRATSGEPSHPDASLTTTRDQNPDDRRDDHAGERSGLSMGCGLAPLMRAAEFLASANFAVDGVRAAATFTPRWRPGGRVPHARWTRSAATSRATFVWGRSGCRSAAPTTTQSHWRKAEPARIHSTCEKDDPTREDLRIGMCCVSPVGCRSRSPIWTLDPPIVQRRMGGSGA
jgi:hypothetical protein